MPHGTNLWFSRALVTARATNGLIPWPWTHLPRFRFKDITTGRQKFPWLTNPFGFLAIWVKFYLGWAKFHCKSLSCIYEVWNRWWNAIWVELERVVWRSTSNHRMFRLSIYITGGKNFHFGPCSGLDCAFWSRKDLNSARPKPNFNPLETRAFVRVEAARPCPGVFVFVLRASCPWLVAEMTATTVTPWLNRPLFKLQAAGLKNHELYFAPLLFFPNDHRHQTANFSENNLFYLGKKNKRWSLNSFRVLLFFYQHQSWITFCNHSSKHHKNM